MAAEDRAGFNGMDTYEYINTGTYALPVWSRLKRVGDVDLPNNRSANSFKFKGSENAKTLVGVKERGISFTYTRTKQADPVYTALKAGYDAGNDGCVDMLVLDGPAATIGSKGHRGPYLVVKFDEKNPHETECTTEVELKPADAIEPGGTDPWEIDAFEVTV